MVLETLSSSNEFSNFIIYDTITAEASSGGGGYLENIVSVSHQQQQQHQQHDPAIACDNNCDDAVVMMKKNTRKRQCCSSEPETSGSKVQSNNKKRRRRKARVCKNKEEAETQRITHITVERNRRKQMNEHLAVLRSLMPETYVQRGDQASIVGGAIEFVKELEHLLQSLEARKLQLLQQQVAAAQQAQNNNTNNIEDNNTNNNNNVAISKLMLQQPPFAQFFVYPQYTWSQTPNKYTSKTKAAIADIEVTLIETHANLRILTRIIRPGQLTKIVAGFQTLCLTILHLNVTTIDPLVFYSISAKVEEGFQLGSVEGIATAVHNLLERIEEEASLCC